MSHQVQAMQTWVRVSLATGSQAGSSLTPANLPSPSPQQEARAPPGPGVQGTGRGTYPVSRWPRGPLGLAILALLPLWTQRALRHTSRSW